MIEEVRDRVLERFLRYVQVDTQSNEASQDYPSTAKQFDLLRPLVEELKEIGLADAAIDDWGYVMATLPATPGHEDVPVIGWLAHVDTSPEMSGADVKPIVHRGYDGGDLVLPDDPSQVLRFADNPALAEQIGQDLVTASGTTLLGADNKAGVAEIMTAAEYLMRHPEIPHGPIRVGFTPDEEVGRGTLHFDVERFGARFAYTVDGETLGEIQQESFSADTMVVTFQGFNTHPAGQRDQGRLRFRLAPAAPGPLPGDHRGPRGLRPPLRLRGERRQDGRAAADPRLPHRGSEGEGGPARQPRGRDDRRLARRAGRDAGGGELPQHARGARPPSRGRRARA